ncbi:MAG TPA: macrolide ABC transporter ATP-binding protein [Lentisphaeria bacterium]|nr:macrolide ABC transporter ATP-binding protein [Lentisphaeria bacterium]HCG47970.1 macrolide ABC transporter ATP-binding protein [Lentisphaeria bacterium]
MNETQENGKMIYLSAEKISKSFRISSHKVEVLKSVSLTVEQGEWVALLGSSGSGKTTLLDIMGTISHPDSGSLQVGGVDVLALSSRETVTFRRHKIGFVFQAYHMLPELNICENVMLPSMLDGMSKKEAREKALVLLDRVGLAHRVRHRANELSGGEQQRAAIARSLMNSPELLLADEPTGNLDSVTGQGILDIFHELRSEGGMTIVMVTHDKYVAGLAGRTVELKDGMLI